MRGYVCLERYNAVVFSLELITLELWVASDTRFFTKDVAVLRFNVIADVFEALTVAQVVAEARCVNDC